MIRWIDRYEWRTLTELERCAMGVFHKSIGDGMVISYDSLPSSKSGFRDGLHFLQEISEWAEAYEARFMVPDEKNHQIANETTALLLHTVPSFLKPAGRKFVSALMDTRLRRAMKYNVHVGNC